MEHDEEQFGVFIRVKRFHPMLHAPCVHAQSAVADCRSGGVAWLTRSPVKAEIAGSNPVRSVRRRRTLYQLSTINNLTKVDGW